MARFNEVVGEFDPDNIPETFVDDLNAAYTEDLSVPQAKIDELHAKADLAEKTIAELKSRNYDLMTAIPADNDTGDAPDSSGDPDEPTVDALIDQIKGAR